MFTSYIAQISAICRRNPPFPAILPKILLDLKNNLAKIRPFLARP
jgi:hypothetical protein